MLAVGHTHRPLIRSINNQTIVNAGSVGLPFDSDTRSSYAQLTWNKGIWRSEIIRINYDRHKAEQDFHKYGYLEEGGPLVKLVLIELNTAQSQLYCWTDKYQKQVLAGILTMQESVDKFIQQF